MANIRDVMGGLAIILKYDRGDGERGPNRRLGTVSAEHDAIYAGVCVGGRPEDLTEKDGAELERLRWFWDEEFDCWRRFV